MITGATFTDRMRAVLDGELDDVLTVVMDAGDAAMPMIDPADPTEWRAALLNLAVELDLTVYYRGEKPLRQTREILQLVARDADFAAALDARGLLR